MKIVKLIQSVLFASIVGGLFASVMDINSIYPISILLITSLTVSSPVDVISMAFQTEVWSKDVKEILFSKIFAFVRNSINHDGFVTNKTVHVPQGGAIPAVAKNRAVLPATISQRTDTDLTYNLASYTTDPILVTDLEQLQANYDKRNSILNQQINAMNSRIAEETLINWAADSAENIIVCSGAATADIAPPSGTGNRTLLTLLDISKAAAHLDAQEVPFEGRYLAIPSKMYWSFVESNKAQLLSLDFNKGLTEQDIMMGVVSKVYGFNIIVRSVTVVYATGGTTPKAYGAAAAATDLYGAVGWQKDCVCNALGSIKTYFEADKPDYYGSVLSAEVLHASAKARIDKAGIITLQQA